MSALVSFDVEPRSVDGGDRCVLSRRVVVAGSHSAGRARGGVAEHPSETSPVATEGVTNEGVAVPSTARNASFCP